MSEQKLSIGERVSVAASRHKGMRLSPEDVAQLDNMLAALAEFEFVELLNEAAAPADCLTVP